MPEGTQRFLNLRSLPTANRRLAEMLRPGLAVLDVGCGTGAITCGVAGAVAPDGRAVGVDVHAGLIAEARRAHGGVPRLSFAVAGVEALPFRDEFDSVCASRMVQWLADPRGALRAMAAAARPGGRVLVLDYNHEKIEWTPDPPERVRAFYAAFLRWRSEAGMDNGIADRLGALFRGAGLSGVEEWPQHEQTRRGAPDFEARVGIWAEIAATRGHQMVADGFLTERERAAAEADYRRWMQEAAQSQRMYLIAVEGRKPG